MRLPPLVAAVIRTVHLLMPSLVYPQILDDVREDIAARLWEKQREAE